MSSALDNRILAGVGMALVAGIGAGPGHAATPPGAASGGAMVRPAIDRVACLSGCAPRRAIRAGSTVRLRGSGLAPVTRVVFQGRPGKADDARVEARAGSDRTMRVRVPAVAVGGPVVAIAGRYAASLPSKPLRIVAPPSPKPLAPAGAPGRLTPVPGPREPGGPAVETGLSRSTAFFGAKGGVSFSYRVSDDGPVNVTVELVRATDGAVVQSWPPSDTSPGAIRTVVWNGMAAGALQPEGRYAFRLSARGTRGATARSAQAGDAQRDAFDFYQHIFPVRLKHDYGEAGARFGTSRAGHSHQGQDVFARCGARLVAARGGEVKFSQYNATAGFYVVVNGIDTGVDYVYMHLAEASPLRAGERVFTGQQIGTVGDSGNASGCHLHFEMWSKPGWYDGGKPFDPLPRLQAWDVFS